MLNTHVEHILVEGGRAAGVRLRDGSILRAKKVCPDSSLPFVGCQDDLTWS